MTSTRLWDRAGALTVRAEDRLQPSVAALPTDRLPSIAELFEFMRDAELRFGTLRLRIEDRTRTSRGESLEIIDVVMRHPGEARVTTTDPSAGTAGGYEVWISDGETVRTYAARHRLGTRRPVRARVVGLDGPDLPGMSRVYEPVTALPMETLPDTFVHPAGLCQNVLATGACEIAGTDVVADREAIVLVADHPRTTERIGDRPDFQVEIAVDRATGIILRLLERLGPAETRRSEVSMIQPDAPIPPSAFDFEFPSDTTFIY
jgi:outer membrane lipoprotein-sorting protein